MQVDIAEYINNIESNDLIFYIAIGICILFIFSTLKIDLNILYGSIVAILVLFYINSSNNDNTSNFNINLDYKLNTLLEDESLPPPSHFYLDPNLIELFYEIKDDFRLCNRDTYVKTIIAINNILILRYNCEQDALIEPTELHKKLESWEDPRFSVPLKQESVSFGINDIVQNFEDAQDQYKLAMNLLYSFIINVPSSYAFYTKHKNLVIRAQLFLKRNLDLIQEYVDLHNSKTGIYKKTKFIIDYDDAQPYSLDENSKELHNSFEMIV